MIAMRIRPRGFSALAMCRVMVIGRPSAAIAASSVTPEVRPENTPIVVAEYLCAATVQKAKPRADMATVFVSRNREPRYRASFRMFLMDLRICAGKAIAAVTDFMVL
jgi:hypothetical protein